MDSSIVAGNGLSMTAKGKITNEGSDLVAGGDIFLEAEEVEFLAGENSTSSKTSTSFATTTVGGNTAGDINMSGSVGGSERKSSSLTHRNATATAGGTFTVKTSGNASFKGANVVADVVDMTEIGGEVIMESLLDEMDASNESKSANLGIGKTSSQSSVTAGANYSQGSTTSKMVGTQTSIIGKSGVKVSAKKLTNKGAVLAQVGNYDEVEEEKSEFLEKFYEENNLDKDSELSDAQKETISAKISELESKKSSGDNLEISVQELVVEDVQGTYRQKQTGGGLSLTYSQDKKDDKQANGNVSLQYGGHEKDQVAKATIGNGKITVGGKDYKNENLNRDISKSLEITKDEEFGGYDVSVNVNYKIAKDDDGNSAGKWGSSTLDGFKNIPNLLENTKQAVKNGVDGVSDAVEAVSQNIGKEADGDGFVTDFKRKGAVAQSVLNEFIANQEGKKDVINVLNNLKGSKKEDVEKTMEKMAKDFVDAEGVGGNPDIVIFEGDKLTKEQKLAMNGVDKSGTKGFYDPVSGKIFINASALDGSATDLIKTLGNELSHYKDAQNGITFDGLDGKRQAISDRLDSEFSRAWDRVLDLNNSTSDMSKWTSGVDYSEANELVGKVKEAQPKGYIKGKDNSPHWHYFDDGEVDGKPQQWGVWNNEKTAKLGGLYGKIRHETNQDRNDYTEGNIFIMEDETTARKALGIVKDKYKEGSLYMIPGRNCWDAGSDIFIEYIKLKINKKLGE